MTAEKYQEKSLAGRTYFERLHGDVKADSPTIIAMHWMTGTFTVIDFLFEQMPTPARLVFIQGAYASGHEAGGFSWFPREMVFYDEMSDVEQAPLIRAEAAKIATFIEKLKDQHSGKIIVTGMSQGGDLSLHLAAHYSELIDVAIPCAGRLSKSMRPAKIETQKLPLVYMQQGTEDAIVSVASAQDVHTWLSAQNFDAELDTYMGVGHDISAEMISRIQAIISAQS